MTQNIEMKKQEKLKLGIKLIIGFHILNTIIFIIGQGGATIAYDTVAQWGLQHDAIKTADPFIIIINRAVGLADFLIAVPIFILATIGLMKMKFYGIMTSFMILGINFYWTAVAWIKQIFYIQNAVKCEPFAVGTHGMLAFVFLFSIWGSWYLYQNRLQFD